MKLRDRDPLDPRAERELEAVDRALAGESVEADLTAWAELTEMLREERPDPEPEWAAELDEAAASRFSHRPGDGGGGRRTGFAARLDSLFPRRMSPALAGFAVIAVVAIVAASTLSGGDEQPGAGSDDSAATSLEATTADDSAAPREGEAAGGAAEIAPDLGTVVPSSGRTLQGPISPGTENRKQDRDVSMQLAAPPEDVNGVSDEAIAITRDLDGIVASSQVSTAGEDASARLELVIPTRNLDAAIDRLTEIGDVRSLEESSVDITHPYVSAEDRLEDAEAERRELLEALGNAETPEEAEALRLQIADARKEIARAQAAFDRVARQAQLSEVSLTISGDSDASSKDDDRTLGDWWDDAVSVLRDVAGILLISAAILIPAAILLTVVWLILRTVLRRRRERALDE